MENLNMAEYRFRDKLPIIDVVRTGVHKDGRSPQAIAKATHGQITEGTIRKWLYGETLRPQYHKVQAVLRAVGIEIKEYWIETGEIVKPNKALEEFYVQQHKRNLAQRRGLKVVNESPKRKKQRRA
jgi:hypothetical protein